MLSGAPSLRLAVRPLPTRCSSPNPHSRESRTARPVGHHDRSLPGEGLPLPLILALGPAFLKYGGRFSLLSLACLEQALRVCGLPFALLPPDPPPSRATPSTDPP